MFGVPRRWSHFWWLILYPFIGWGFAFCEKAVPNVIHAMEWQPLDGWIPFVPWMVAPYLFWYVAIVLALSWTAFTDADGFRRLSWFLYIGMTFAYVVYLVYPNGQNLRPSLDSLGHTWDGELIRWIYTHDTPTNCNPSIHVIDTMAIWIALGRDKILRKHWWFQVVLAALALMIISSTVLLKQHSVIDVLGGLAVAGVLWVVLYSRFRFSFRFRKP